MYTSCTCIHIELNICITESVQEKVQIVLDSEAVHEEELVEAEAEEETISDAILAYKISCGGMRGMSILKTNHFMTEETNWMKICEFLREE